MDKASGFSGRFGADWIIGSPTTTQPVAPPASQVPEWVAPVAALAALGLLAWSVS